MEIHLLNLSTLQRFLSSLQVKLLENGLSSAFKRVLFNPEMFLNVEKSQQRFKLILGLNHENEPLVIGCAGVFGPSGCL